MPTDNELLHDYARQHSESAFTELVRRHVDMVYSAALRETHGHAALAEDITQSVFSELALKASRLCRHPALAGWLYTCVRHKTANARRADERRQQRELEAHTMKELLAPASPASEWRQLQSVLDDAMHQLTETDRAVVVLRFFEQRTHSDVGLALGLSETAARKRVDRALEKLRAVLGKRGITSTASGLTAALAFGAVLSAPTNVAASVAAGALAVTTSTAATSSTLFKIVTMTKFQAAILGTIVVAGVATPLVMQHRVQLKLRGDNETLRRQVEQLAPLAAETERLSDQLAEASQAEPRSSQPTDELLRLRAEVTALRGRLRDLLAAASVRSPASSTNEPASSDRKRNLKMQVLVGRDEDLKQKLRLTDQQRAAFEQIRRKQVEAVLAAAESQDGTGITRLNADVEAQISALLTPDQQSAYREYQQAQIAANARLRASSELELLQNLLGLKQEQQDAVFDLLYQQELVRGQMSEAFSAASGNQDAAATALRQSQEKTIQDLRALLTPTQFETYQLMMAARGRAR